MFRREFLAKLFVTEIIRHGSADSDQLHCLSRFRQLLNHYCKLYEASQE